MDPNEAALRIDDAQVSETAAELAAGDTTQEGLRRRREREESRWDLLFSRAFNRMTGDPVSDGAESGAAEPRAGSVEERLAYETHAGRLVPVIGPALSSRGIIGVTDRQREARREAGEHRVALVRLLWKSEEYWGPRIVGENFDQHVMMWPQACGVLLGLRDDEHGDVPNPEPPTGPPDTLGDLEKQVDEEFTEPSKAKLAKLQLRLARLLAAATRIWASGLRRRPTALGIQYPHQVVKINRLSVWNPDEIDVFWTALEDVLEATLDLAKNNFEWNPEEPLVIPGAEKHPRPLGNRPCRPNLGAVLLPPEMYLALLLFMTEMGADQNRFAKHHTTYRRAMNSGLSKRVRVEADAVGVRERHLRWLATLLHHTLIAPTQAHRGRRELAFLVSLAKLRAQTHGQTPTSLDVPDLPDAAASDSWPPNDEEMFGSPPAVVRDVLVFTTYSEDGKIMREPSRAGSAVATLSRWALMNSEDCAPPKPAGGLIFVTALDLEIELALASKGPHCVLIPVWIGEETSGGASPRAEWLLGRWAESDAADYNPHSPHREWACLDASQVSEDALWDYKSGPLVVKLHGSPLHGLPEGERLVVSHRLTLGELDVLSMLLNDPVPRRVWAGYSQQKPNNQRQSNPNTLFFLGHDVSSWDGRATWLRLAHPAAPNTERTARRGGVDPELEFAFLNMQAKPVIRESKSSYSFEDLAAILGRVG